MAAGWCGSHAGRHEHRSRLQPAVASGGTATDGRPGSPDRRPGGRPLRVDPLRHRPQRQQPGGIGPGHGARVAGGHRRVRPGSAADPPRGPGAARGGGASRPHRARGRCRCVRGRATCPRPAPDRALVRGRHRADGHDPRAGRRVAAFAARRRGRRPARGRSRWHGDDPGLAGRRRWPATGDRGEQPPAPSRHGRRAGGRRRAARARAGDHGGGPRDRRHAAGPRRRRRWRPDGGAAGRPRRMLRPRRAGGRAGRAGGRSSHGPAAHLPVCAILTRT
jgi:hypothetical protein